MTGFKSKKTAAIDEEGMYLVHQTDHSENNPVHEAMLAYWGERCPDHHKECVCCQAWEHYDGKTSAQEPVEDVVLYHDDGTRIVRIAAKRPWVDLTDEEISVLSKGHMTRNGFARNVLAKSKEKNNG